MIARWIQSQLSSLWTWFILMSYWFTVIMSMFMIIYYAATGSRRFTKAMWVIIITYIFLKGVDAAI